MSKTNCINCGAAKDIEEIKCPFCGTSYFDMTAIDLNEGLPVALTVRKGQMVIQMLALPELKAVEIAEENIRVFDHGSCVGQITKSRSATAELEFKAIARGKRADLLECRKLDGRVKE